MPAFSSPVGIIDITPKHLIVVGHHLLELPGNYIFITLGFFKYTLNPRGRQLNNVMNRKSTGYSNYPVIL
jgi:hypothetical protein